MAKIAMYLVFGILFSGCSLFVQKKDTASSSSVENTNQVREVEVAAQDLELEELTVGEGAEAASGDKVKVDYTGTLTDGTKFDSSVDRGVPFEFNLGAGEVIQGWDMGIVGMKVGGKRKMTIPAELAYGERSPSALIPPNSTLVFEVELLEVTKAR